MADAVTAAPRRDELTVVGVRFGSAVPAVQAALALDAGSVARVLDSLRGTQAALLATCQRTELHVSGLDARGAIAAFHAALGLQGGDLDPACLGADPYVHCGVEAVAHLCRVAAGLDSAQLGDNEVLGQVRAALAAAEAAGTAGPALRGAYRAAVAAGRRARTRTPIGAGGAGLASAVASAVAERRPGAATALVVGAGQAGRAVARRLAKLGLDVSVANRTHEAAAALAAEVGGAAVGLHELPATDVVVNAVPAAVRLPVAHRPLVVDVAVPAAVVAHPGLEVVTLDATGCRADALAVARAAAVPAVEAIVADAVARWANPCSVPTPEVVF